ncbi:MAG: hypothetical protein ACRC8Y_22875, partial [Chroococcales cyanobacterium]
MPMNVEGPKYYDAVMGGHHSPPPGAAVLGGLTGIQTRLAVVDIPVKVSALKDALNYGQAGLELVIDALKDDSHTVRRSAFLLLKHRTEPKAIAALKKFNPYRFFECIHTIQAHRSWVLSL